jgi:hypothetical protein
MHDMRTYLLTARLWAVGMLSGLIFGAGFAAEGWFAGASWQAAALTGVIGGALVGGTLAYASGRQRRDLRAAAGNLSLAQLMEVDRAAARGRIPADPQIRAAAARLARRRIGVLRHFIVLTAVVTILMAIGTVINAIDGDYLLAVSLAAAALLNSAQLYERKRLRRRLQRLSAEHAADQST